MITYFVPMLAQAAIMPLPVPPPPAAPPKSGSFSCKMHDRLGKKFDLSGRMGSISADGDDYKFTAVNIVSPEYPTVSGRYVTFPGSKIVELENTDAKTSFLTKGRLSVEYQPNGMLTLEQTSFDKTKNMHIVGICEINLSPVVMDLPK